MWRYVCLIGILVGIAASVSEEDLGEMHEYVYESFGKCMEEFDLKKEALEDMRKNKDFENIDPCFSACVFKGVKMMDDKGMFDEENSLKIIEKFIKDPDALAKVKQIREICLAVNDEEVGDGPKGCERGVMLFKCFMENKANIMT